jgi:hypothetical protein
MIATYKSLAKGPDTNRLKLRSSQVTFFALTIIIALATYSSLVMTSSIPLIVITLPLVAYDRSFMFPLFTAIPLAQGAFITDEIDSDSMAESIALLTVMPLLMYDFLRLKSRIVPFRFVLWYVLFGMLVVLGLIVYLQHPENRRLGESMHEPSYRLYVRITFKIIKITFYFIYLKVLINYTVERNLRTLEYIRKIAPWIVFMLGIYLLLFGRSQSGAATGDTESLQLGDAHHGAFTSQLCAVGIYMYITIFTKGERFYNKILAAISLAFMFIMIMQMGSRNGLVCFFLVSCLGLYINLKGKRIDYQFLVIFSFVIVGVIGIIYSLNSPTIQRAIYMSTVEEGGNRWYYWEAGIEAIKHYPILGMGGHEPASIAAVAKYGPGFIDSKVMHNSYLEMGVEYGIVGAIFYIAFLGTVFTWSYRLFMFALKKNYILLTAPSVSFLILMFSALFVSRVWETAIWYNMSLVYALCIQLLYAEFMKRKKRNVVTYSSLGNQIQEAQKSVLGRQ